MRRVHQAIGSAGSLLRMRQGGICLFLALMMSGMLPILAFLLQSARLRGQEADIARALSAQVQTGLAAYDRTLLDQYRLWAFRPEQIGGQAFYGTLPPELDHLPLILLPDEPVHAPPVLKQQVIRHMQARLPMIYLEQVIDQLSSLQISADGEDSWLSSVSGWLGRLSGEKARTGSGSLSGGLFGQLEDELANELDQNYREQAASLAGLPDRWADDSLSGPLPDFFDPAALAKLADQLDQLLAFPAFSLFDKVCLVEYTLGYFNRDVSLKKHSGHSYVIISGSGRSLKSFPAERQAEVEQIITGFSSPDLANLATAALLLSMRSLIQLAALLLDQEQMTLIRAGAAALSATLAAATAGSVVIDPEIMTWLIAVTRAMQSGWSDVNRLKDGYAPALWPGEGVPSPSWYYEDYLRLFLLAMPEDLLLERLSALLQRNLAVTYYCRLEARTSWQNRQVAVAGRYP